MDNRDNSVLFDEGMKKAKELISGHIYDMFVNACDGLLRYALVHRTFTGFTGNTQTSYSIGLYVDGDLSYVCSTGETLDAPIRLKVRKGETAYLENPYEGDARAVKGKVNVDKLYGEQTAFKFLKSYKPSVRKGFAMVMCTGTEYSEYLENARNLDVLTGTFMQAPELVFKNFKPIK